MDNKSLFEAEGMAVACEADCERAATYLSLIKAKLREIAAAHQEVVAPIKKGIAAFESRIRSVRQPLEGLEAAIKTKVASYWASQEAVKRLATESARAAEIAAANKLAAHNAELALQTGSDTAAQAAAKFDARAMELATRPLDLSQTVRTTHSTLAHQKVWAWRVTDLSKIDRQYLIVDESQLNKLLKLCTNAGLMPTVDGVEFYQETRVVVTR